MSGISSRIYKYIYISAQTVLIPIRRFLEGVMTHIQITISVTVRITTDLHQLDRQHFSVILRYERSTTKLKRFVAIIA